MNERMEVRKFFCQEAWMMKEKLKMTLDEGGFDEGKQLFNLMATSISSRNTELSPQGLSEVHVIG